MDFDLSPDQSAFRDAAEDFLAGQCPPARVRAAYESNVRWDPELWTAMVDLGWLGAAVPEAGGGLGLGWVEVAVLLEMAGRHVVPVPLLSSVVAIEVARRAGADDLVARLADGTTACVAWCSDRSTLRATGATLTGRSDPVAFAPTADLALITAPVDHDGDERAGERGRAVFVVELTDDLRPEIATGMDLSRPLGWLEFDQVAARRLGGDELASTLTDFGAAATVLELLGTSAVAMELAVQYAKDRVQFGRPIGSFQAVKHRCADMLVDVEGIRSSAYWAAWCLSVNDPDASIAASTAKIWAGDASKRVMASALQVHGGVGFTWEHDLHLFMKRAQLDQLSFGDSSWHRARLGAFLRAKVDAGSSVL